MYRHRARAPTTSSALPEELPARSTRSVTSSAWRPTGARAPSTSCFFPGALGERTGHGDAHRHVGLGRHGRALSGTGGIGYYQVELQGHRGPLRGCRLLRRPLRASTLNKPIVGIAADRRRRWVLAGRLRRGHLHLRGRRVLRLRRRASPSTSPWSAWPPTFDGGGYWLVASDGGIFSLRRRPVLRLDRGHRPQQAHRGHGGHARRQAATGWWPPTAASSPTATPTFYGSTGSIHLNKPIVGMAADARRRRLLAGGLRRRHLRLRRRPRSTARPGASNWPSPSSAMAAMPDGERLLVHRRRRGSLQLRRRAVPRCCRRQGIRNGGWHGNRRRADPPGICRLNGGLSRRQMRLV